MKATWHNEEQRVGSGVLGIVLFLQLVVDPMSLLLLQKIRKYENKTIKASKASTN